MIKICVSIDIGNRKLLMIHQDNFFFCNLVTLKGELIEKVLPTLNNDIDEGWKRLHVKIIEE